MKFLIITQAVDRDDPVLGFFHEWIAEFAKHCEHVEVICLREGKHDLPSNVRVHSLGKEGGPSRIKYLWRFYKYIWSLRHEYETVFVHMNPEYILLGGMLWRLMGKHIGLWYVHSSVTMKLRIATLITHSVFTTSPESFRIRSPKVHAMGHGIPIERFVPSLARPHDDIMHIITVGRISPTKRIREMLHALDELHQRGVPFTFTIVGAPVTAADRAYEAELRGEVAQCPYTVEILGAVSSAELPRILAQADLSLNLSKTESMDKAVLESFASGVPVVSSNRAFRTVLEPCGLFCADVDPATIAEVIRAYQMRGDRERVRAELRAYVEREHSLSRLIPAIVREYGKSVR